jgi:predicted metalloprotease with PDZ domain
VVRLEGIKDLADQFVRVRIPRIDEADLNLFEFDYDLTFMVFFLDANEHVYGRFGGRDAKSAEGRMSLAGLHYAMEGALETHKQANRLVGPDPPRPAPRTIREVATGRRMGGRCLHCHQVKEILNAELERAGKWDRDLAWRYPPPDNLGLVLSVDRGNQIEQIKAGSAAAKAGLQVGDLVQCLNGIAIHSFGDAQYALDRAPKSGTIPVSWRHGDTTLEGELTLTEGWRKTNVTWRPSMHRYRANVRLYGTDLTAKEKEALGLSAKTLAFRQEERVHPQARDAGIQGGDVILGIDGQKLEMDVTDFVWYVQDNYLRGDKITVNLLRHGKRLDLPMTLSSGR